MGSLFRMGVRNRYCVVLFTEISVLLLGICTPAFAQIRSTRHEAGEWCQVDKDCKQGLICWDDTCWAREDLCRRALLIERGDGEKFSYCYYEGKCSFKWVKCEDPDEVGCWDCFATSNKDCRAHLLCREEGRCTAKGGECVLTSSNDCRNTTDCIEEGYCTYVPPSEGEPEGYCAIASSADCARSRNCKKLGSCNFLEVDGELGCYPSKGIDCSASAACRASGACGLSDHDCVPLKKSHCLQSENCRRDGKCFLDPSGNECTWQEPE